MVNKIFIGLCALAVILMGIITFITSSQLQSIGFAPAQIAENFAAYDSLYKSVLWISSLILLVLANVVLWTSRRAWALWLTFGYFAFFLMLNMWWLSESLVFYKKQNGLFDESFRIGGLIGAIFVIVAGLGVFFNQFVVLHMLERLYPATASETQATPDASDPADEQTGQNAAQSPDGEAPESSAVNEPEEKSD